MKKIFVSDMSEGVKVDDVFLVTSKTVASTRNGSQFVRLKLSDKTGEVDAVKWDASESEITRIHEDEYVHIRGIVNIYRENFQLTLETIKKSNEEVDPSDFLRCTPCNIDDMFSELKETLLQIKNPYLVKLINDIFARPNFAKLFCEAPAAKSVHQAYIGGLLEHTLNVVKICVSLACLYPQIDKDLLITAAALHDVGKIDEYTWTGSVKISDEGHLIGHIVSGAMLIRETASEIEGFDPMLSMVLQHMILSHHGLKEYGSPKQPKSMEAEMLHAADDLDAKMAIFSEAIDESETDGLFTKKHFILDRPIFKGLPIVENNKDELNLEGFAVETDTDPFAEE